MVAKMNRQEIERKIEEKNKQFKRLSKTEKRVAIAKDVLQQLDEKSFKAESCYLDVARGDDEKRIRCLIQNSPEEKASYALASAKCEVCGIGSLFVSTIELENKATVSDLFDNTENYEAMSIPFVGKKKMADTLSKYFDEDQLDLIEAYFERTVVHANGNLRITDINENSPIWETNRKSERLRMIMNNIIENKGKFKP